MMDMRKLYIHSTFTSILGAPERVCCQVYLRLRKDLLSIISIMIQCYGKPKVAGSIPTLTKQFFILFFVVPLV